MASEDIELCFSRTEDESERLDDWNHRVKKFSEGKFSAIFAWSHSK